MRVTPVSNVVPFQKRERPKCSFCGTAFRPLAADDGPRYCDYGCGAQAQPDKTRRDMGRGAGPGKTTA